MKLETKHLAPYLPYKLKMKFHNWETYELHGLSFTDEGEPCTIRDGNFSMSRSNIKLSRPILRPLSDLTKKIEYDGREFIPYNELVDVYGFEHIERANKVNLQIEDYVVRRCSYYLIQKLLEWHFDIFGLIPKKLAIDINKL